VLVKHLEYIQVLYKERIERRMQYQKENNFNGFRSGGSGKSPFNLGTLLIAVVSLILMFVIARFVFRMLYFLAPFLLVATAIIDYKVITGYVGWLIGLTKRNTGLGIAAIILSILGFPIVTAGLFGKALFNRQVRKAQQQKHDEIVHPEIGEYVDFEEIKREKPMRLPEIEKREEPRRQKPDNEYDQFFK